MTTRIEYIPGTPREKAQLTGLTEDAMAERFAEIHRDRVIYVEKRGWHVYDDKRFVFDEEGLEVDRLMAVLVQDCYSQVLEAAENLGSAEAVAVAKYLHVMSRSNTRAGALSSVRSLMKATIEQLDADLNLLNVNNGTLDLTTLELREHDPGDLITKLAPVDYVPGAVSQRWLDFMDLITGGVEELQDYMKGGAGYSLTGRSILKLLFFLWGRGDNGKTTLVETYLRLLGDYAVKVKSEALMASGNRNGEGASPYLMQLMGVRLVITSETNEDMAWNDSLVKDVSGGDSLQARDLYKSPVTFKPTHVVWVYGNFKPKVRQVDDDALWNRLRIVPFTVTILKAQQRPMDEVIDEFIEEGPGILNWMLEGLQALRENGFKLEDPQIVTEATVKYRNEENWWMQFVEEHVIFDNKSVVAKADVYDAWAWYAKRNKTKERTQIWTTNRMLNHGCRYQDGDNKSPDLVGARFVGIPEHVIGSEEERKEGRSDDKRMGWTNEKEGG